MPCSKLAKRFMYEQSWLLPQLQPLLSGGVFFYRGYRGCKKVTPRKRVVHTTGYFVTRNCPLRRDAMPACCPGDEMCSVQCAVCRRPSYFNLFRNMEINVKGILVHLLRCVRLRALHFDYRRTFQRAPTGVLTAPGTTAVPRCSRNSFVFAYLVRIT